MSAKTCESDVDQESDSALRRAMNFIPARIAAQAIMADICDRKGLKNEFLQMWDDNEKMARHIELVWQTIIEKAYVLEVKKNPSGLAFCKSDF